MNAKKTAVVLGASVLAIGAGVFAFRRLRAAGLLGRDHVVPATTAPPPMVGRRQEAGMDLRLYRAAHIPINQRVRLIQDRVWNGVTDPRIRKLALELTQGCPRNDGECEAKRIFAAVHKRVRYTGDGAPVRHPDGTVEPIDYFQNPWRTWEMRGGDCDDHSGLISALTSVIGIPTRLRVTAPSKFADWAHIYPVVGFPKEAPRKWRAIDTTLPGRVKAFDEARFGRKRDYAPHKDYPA